MQLLPFRGILSFARGCDGDNLPDWDGSETSEGVFRSAKSVTDPELRAGGVVEVWKCGNGINGVNVEIMEVWKCGNV